MVKSVGITCHRESRAGRPDRDAVNCAYSASVANAGGLPVLLPIAVPAMACGYLDRVDGLLLPGGIDVEPRRFGQAPHPMLGETDGLQDAFEIALAQEAWRRRMPILAICRGIQLLNVALGGTLIQDLPSDRPSDIAHWQTEPRPQTTHDLIVEENTQLFRLVGPHMAVNSFHHQALDSIAADLRVVGRAPDGVVEAVESEVHPRLIAVQCHPEEMTGTDARARSLFAQFVSWL